MTFIFNGIRIKKNLTEEQRAALVEDTYQRLDKKTGKMTVVRRVTYYDPKKRFNVYVTSQKVGFVDAETGKVVPEASRKSPRVPVQGSATDALADASDQLTDSRQEGKVVYGLAPTMEIMLCQALGGGFGPKAASLYWEKYRAFFEKRWQTELPKSAPSISTLNRLLRLIDPDELQKLYQQFVFPLLPDPNVRDAVRSVVAVDGQAIRASRNEAGEQHQVLSFYSTETGIAFAQALVDTKSNEIPAAYDLIQVLDLHGVIVTGDAMHCQRKFTEALMNTARADYCLVLKQNQGTLVKSVMELFNSMAVELHAETVDRAHGREELRRIEVLPGSALPDSILKKWFGLEFGCIVKQTSLRTVIGTNGESDKTSEQTRYFITSLTPTEEDVASQLLQVIRRHWAIENSLHHVLDCDFNQDRSQTKNANLTLNLAHMNKFALSILELVRRLKFKEQKTLRRLTINELRRGLQNDPALAIEYIDTFLLHSKVAELNRVPEPLTV